MRYDMYMSLGAEGLRVAISDNTSGIEIKITVNKKTYLLTQKVTGYKRHTCSQLQEAQTLFTR